MNDCRGIAQRLKDGAEAEEKLEFIKKMLYIDEEQLLKGTQEYWGSQKESLKGCKVGVAGDPTPKATAILQAASFYMSVESMFSGE